MQGISLSESFFDNFWVNQIDSLTDKTVDTGIESFYQRYQQSKCLPPNGFIFHMSRCGSTLLANMLRRVKGTLAFSEPAALDPVFTVLSNENLEQMIRLYGSITDQETNYILKFPSYAAVETNLINTAFPDTPKIFLYRNPEEVVISNLQDPTQKWIYSSHVSGLTKEQIFITNSVIKNIVIGLKRTCETFYDNMDEHSFCLNYNQLADPRKARTILLEILRRFKVQYEPADIDKALEEMNYYSKDQFKEFSPVQQKEKVPPEIRDLVQEHLMPIYEKLEKIQLVF